MSLLLELGPNLEDDIARLQPTPGYCIFIDSVGSTALKDSEPRIWLSRLHDVFVLAKRYLNDYQPLKIIGDAMLYMLEQPRLNLMNSAITCLFALVADIWLILTFGVTGAAVGILVPYVVIAVLRYRTLRRVFGWPNRWADLTGPFVAAAIAGVPAVMCRVFISGMPGEITGSVVFGAIYLVAWSRRHGVGELRQFA